MFDKQELGMLLEAVDDAKDMCYKRLGELSEITGVDSYIEETKMFLSEYQQLEEKIKKILEEME